VPAEKPSGPPSQGDADDGVMLMSSVDARSSGLSWREGTREFYRDVIGKLGEPREEEAPSLLS
jgi:hypothetical protein